MLWKLCRPFFSETTLEKTFIEQENICQQLVDIFHPSQLEERYGGSAPNMKKFWPPTFPQSGEYGHDPELIMSQEEYEKMKADDMTTAQLEEKKQLE